MKLIKKIFLFFFATSLSSIFCQQSVSLIGSRFASSDLQYKTFLVKHGIGPDTSIKFGPKDGQKLAKNDSRESSVGRFSFNATEDASKYELKISSKTQNACKEQSVDVLNVARSPIVFLHFHKPIYRTNEVFKFRVFILTRALLPMPNYFPIHVILKDANKEKIMDYEATKTTDQFGVYEDVIEISRLSNHGRMKLGVWTIEVKVNDRTVAKTFEVQDANDDAEVFVEASPNVAFVDRRTYLYIYTVDPYGRYAEISVKANFVNSSRVEINKFVKRVPLTDSKTSVSLDFRDELDIKYPISDMNLDFTIRITGPNPSTVKKYITMKHKEKNTIQTIRKKYFKPEFKFPVKVRVRTLDGKPDNSLNQLTSTIKYVSKLKDEYNKPKIVEKTVKTNLKNGETIHQLQPKADTDKILISFEFAGTEYSEMIERFPGVDEYMQVTVLSKNTTVGATVQIKVQSTEEMELPRLLIFGTKGIIHNQKIEDAAGKDVFEFPLELTDEMRPEARGLVFYTRASDGAMVYDEFSLSIGFTIENSIEIFAPDAATSDQMVNIAVKTQEGSQVFLIATDVNSALYSHENEISRTSIYNEIVYHLNRKFEPTSDYHFEKLNAVILNPLKNGRNCGFSSRLGNINDEVTQQNTDIDTTPHKYFPAALQVTAYVAASSDNQTIQYKFPDSTKTWKIYGISVHPEKGFTVAKTQPEVAVKSKEKEAKLNLEITGPTSVLKNEVYSVIVKVTNVVRTHLNARLTVSITGGVFNHEPITNSCIQHHASSKSSVDMNVVLTPDKPVQQKYLQFKSEQANPITIKVKATAGQVKGEALKTIEVKEDLEKKSVLTKLIDKPDRTSSFEMILNATTPKTFAVIYGNILGPAVNGLEYILSRKMILDEDKVLKFGTEVVIFEFLKNARPEESKKAAEELQNIRTYYGEVRDILLKIINENDSKRISLAALIADIMLDASRSTNIIDHNLIDRSLNFIQRQYINNNHKFAYDADADVRRDISSSYREAIQTALITKVVLRKNWDLFSEELNNLFRNRGNYAGDHIVSIAAYVLAYHNQHDDSSKVLEKMNHGYSSNKTYAKHNSMYVQVIAYEILTKIRLNRDPSNEVNKLLKHRNADGAFYSPYDTYLALKALSEYSKYRNILASDFVFSLNQVNYFIGLLDSKTFKANNQRLTANNQQLGYVNVYEEGNQILVPIKSAFVLTRQNINRKPTLNIDIAFTYKKSDANGPTSNLVALEVDLPEGYQTKEGHTQGVVYYFPKIKYDEINEKTIELKEITGGTKFDKALYIKIYDYYRPNLKHVSLLCDSFNF